MRRLTPVAGCALLVVAALVPAVADPAPAATTHPGVQVNLVDAGAAPRSRLRLTPNAASQSVVLTLGTEVTQSGLASQHLGPLDIQTVVSFAPSATAANGTIRAPYTYGSFKLLDTSAGTPDQLAAIRQAFSQFQGFGGQLTLSPTGAVIANTFSIPPAASAPVKSLLQQLSGESDQFSVPLPSEPVGIGAHWRGTTHLLVGGISSTQTYDYTLRSRAGTSLAIDARYIQTAAGQRAALPGIPSGTTVTVTGYRIAGSGSTVTDLSRIAAVSGHVEARGLQRFRLESGGHSGTISQQVRLSVDLAAG